jgi:NAD(P)-dependent dehydrogenase (short-subunit alcohol dehydrogenase family)
MGALDGKVAVVTGGASGIGEATVRLFVEEGARVLIADMQEERGRSLADAIGKEVLFQPCEVSREEQVADAIARAHGAFGRLDCIFNNAGFGGALGPIDETPVEEFDLTLAVLVRGVFLGMKHAAPLMKAQGSGSIINTGSVAGLSAGFGPHVYSAAKAAVIHLTRSVALELAEHSVRVNCICPGFIATPLSANAVGGPAEAVERIKPQMAEAQPIPRSGEPEDIARMALWLASDASTFVTGQALAVDGGVALGRKWSDLPGFFRRHRPIKVYRPEGS